MNRMKVLLFLIFTIMVDTIAQQKSKPFRLGIAGLTHSHVHWILQRAHDGDVEIVGIAEPDKALAERYLKQYKLPSSLWFAGLDEMLQQTRPEAVTAFNSINGHLSVVEACAPKGIHVMVEKPLAATYEQAREMEALAKQYNIHLLTNYETTWYGSNKTISGTVDDGAAFGSIRKIVVHDGHQGPKEIGVNIEFLEWLTDPVQNGGGALMDFGCYGANLATWLMKGERPQSVFAITQQFKPDIYPKVDDEATIVLSYPKAQAIIQASWNWPYSRKDIEVYGVNGYIIADRQGSRLKPAQDEPERFIASPELSKPLHDPFAYLAAVVRKQVTVDKNDLSSLENNMIVMEILEAAKQSAKQGKRIQLGGQ